MPPLSITSGVQKTGTSDVANGAKAAVAAAAAAMLHFCKPSLTLLATRDIIPSRWFMLNFTQISVHNRGERLRSDAICSIVCLEF